ncbi:glycosyl hydrolase [Chitinophaga parva]|uniref:Glycosyl hydrolase n=1 Tax=Chitinophaga parva TaxID=2169414 RepID=A0A2T7BHM2_9BACT|nr:glycoside hydrolase family 3 C-terminal domain-containing protein [Chitinophaga parva]PUZ25768.1 glycosyl hydrolase [Chitinophaga parva]
MIRSIAGILCLCFASSCIFAQTAPQLGHSPLPEVVKAMTTEEKVKLIVGMGMRIEDLPPGMLPPADPGDDQVPEKVPGAAGRTHAIPRLGIPSIVLSDGPAGVRINPIRNGDSAHPYYATAFPVGTLLASSWDTALVRRVGQAFGKEALDYGIDVLLSPAINLQRNPLGGRNFEYYSEDPVVAGNIAAALINGVQANHVGTSLKHFAANNQEFNRMQLNTHVSERALRELYLRGFEIAIKQSQPWTVMSSYNLVNDTYTSESRPLLTDILRDEWGFKGFVMTDWFGGQHPVAQMNAGNDMLMPGTHAQTEALLAGVQSGVITPAQLDENVTRILNIILLSPAFKHYNYSDKPDLKAHAAVSRAAAAEGMVLLKNKDNVLPLAQSRRIALFGNTSYDLIAGGTGSGDVNKAYVVSLLEGMQAANFPVDAALSNTYQVYIAAQKNHRSKPAMAFLAPPPIAEMPLEETLLQAKAASNDIALVTIGRLAGEGGDRKVDDDYTLTAAELQNLHNISNTFHAKGKKVIVIMNIGGVMDVSSWRDDADAILLAWQPGQEGGHAIADVVTGKVNPSGKLTATFPVHYEDVPSARTFPGQLLHPDDSTAGNPLMGKPAEVSYEEGIYVGYRYYKTFNIKAAYEFGYGLSYTNFSYGKVTLSGSHFDGTPMTATLTVTNSGKVPGKEVVELYLAAPAKMADKPAQELKAFAKTKLLAPGASQTLTFTLSIKDLASFNTAQSSWIADAGNYEVRIGASSEDVRQTATFTLDKEMLAEKVHTALAPQLPLHELHP